MNDFFDERNRAFIIYHLAMLCIALRDIRISNISYRKNHFSFVCQSKRFHYFCIPKQRSDAFSSFHSKLKVIVIIGKKIKDIRIGKR